MNIWDNFYLFAYPTLILWVISIVLILLKKGQKTSSVLIYSGLTIFAIYIILLWFNLQRPPLRTMGETRLWYSFFLTLLGVIVHFKWKFNWLLAYTVFVACIFIIINLVKPEIHSKTLMPALQSKWFIPHVISYIISYALLSAAAISAIAILKDFKNSALTINNRLQFTDKITIIGFGLFMSGMLMGALWAKEAWGNYWSWDPKETWAFATAAGYLVYIHLRITEKNPQRITLWILIISFIMLMITWKGVAYLPSAQNSIHLYQ